MRTWPNIRTAQAESQNAVARERKGRIDSGRRAIARPKAVAMIRISVYPRSAHSPYRRGDLPTSRMAVFRGRFFFSGAVETFGRLRTLYFLGDGRAKVRPDICARFRNPRGD